MGLCLFMNDPYECPEIAGIKQMKDLQTMDLSD